MNVSNGEKVHVLGLSFIILACVSLLHQLVIHVSRHIKDNRLSYSSVSHGYLPSRLFSPNSTNEAKEATISSSREFHIDIFLTLEDFSCIQM